MRNARQDETQAIIKIVRRNINNFTYADNTILVAESEEELKRILKKVKEESEKGGLKHNIQKMKIMASSPITSWQIDREKNGKKWETIFLGSKFIADGNCSHKIKMFAPWKKSYDKPRQCIKKQRQYFAVVKFKSIYVIPASGFASRHVQMWEMDHKEDWVPKNWCF